MKLLLPAIGFVALAGALGGQGEETLIVIGGDVHGYLSPCGCTKPMSGGIRRRATAVRNLTSGKKALVLENGGLAHGIGRQDELKAEALAETLKAMGVDGVNVSASDAALGKGMLEAIDRLSGHRLVCTSISGGELPFKNALEAEGFLVGGVTLSADQAATNLGRQGVMIDDAIESLVFRAKGKPIVLMLDGPLSEARRIAQSQPAVRLIVYSSTGDPPSKPEVEGDTWLVTPGEKGKSVVRFKFRGGKFDDYVAINLGPEIPDDPDVARIFARYLGRVVSEKLLEKLPRSSGPKLAGNPTCGVCHIEAMGVWEKTKHAGALATLEEVGQDRDPDCVGCHVVGLESDKGFQSRSLTPQFTDVGCESCHGPGGEHAADPSVRMGKVGEASCAPCHTREHSPGFDFAAYWEKIKH